MNGFLPNDGPERVGMNPYSQAALGKVRRAWDDVCAADDTRLRAIQNANDRLRDYQEACREAVLLFPHDPDRVYDERNDS